MRLNKAQLEEFKTTGFLLIRNLYNAETIKTIAAWTEEITNYLATPGKYIMYFEQKKLCLQHCILSRIENIEPFHQGFSELFLHGKIQQITSQLFADNAILFKDKINFKMPGADGFKAHQDVQAGWDHYARLQITALISINPSTVENGCLEIAKGYHNKGLIREYLMSLEEEALAYRPLPTVPGNAIFFGSYAPHRSKKNLTKHQRLILYITHNVAKEGDHRYQYYHDKRLNYLPDIERHADQNYRFKV